MNYPDLTLKIEVTPMGRLTTHIVTHKGAIYGKLAPLYKYLGHYNSPSVNPNFITKVGKDNLIKVSSSKQSFWFINLIGFKNLIKFSNKEIAFDSLKTIYSQVFGEEHLKDIDNPFTYGFTDSEMLEIINSVNNKPINKEHVTRLLFRGKL